MNPKPEGLHSEAIPGKEHNTLGAETGFERTKDAFERSSCVVPALDDQTSTWAETAEGGASVQGLP